MFYLFVISFSVVFRIYFSVEKWFTGQTFYFDSYFIPIHVFNFDLYRKPFCVQFLMLSSVLWYSVTHTHTHRNTHRNEQLRANRQKLTHWDKHSHTPPSNQQTKPNLNHTNQTRVKTKKNFRLFFKTTPNTFTQPAHIAPYATNTIYSYFIVSLFEDSYWCLNQTKKYYYL